MNRMIAPRAGREAVRRSASIGRRTFIASLVTAGIAMPRLPAFAAEPPSFGFQSVQDQAAALAKEPYRSDTAPLPPPLKNLDYAHFQMIRFRADRMLWRDSGLFRIEPIHRGFQYDRKVSINLIENGVVSEVGYDPTQFDFGQNTFATDFGPSFGFAGLRLCFPLNRPKDFDEFAVFLGASYFRIVGRGQQYGASARGLAIDTAGPQGEEFPIFTTFWLERPAPNATSITLYALLDSKSTTGAYQITFAPGTATRAHVAAVLYPRLDIKKLGLAPLTSMFLHGKPGNRPFLDLRPEVHDSDTIVLHSGTGEWLSRPLLNPRLLRVSSFSDRDTAGFGLAQRETAFRQYQDSVRHYERRPFLWVEPQGDWATGIVELVEIPSDDEINDNIVAYWVPQQVVKAGTSLAIAYRLTAMPGATPLPTAARCIGTHSGPAPPVDATKEPRNDDLVFWLDFSGGDLASLSDEMPVEPMITVSTGKVQGASCQKLDSGTWRASFVFTPEGRADSEMRAFLRLREDTLSETWTYRWSET